MRSGQKNYVYSRIMCWVAFDRGLRLADKRSFPCPRAKWNESNIFQLEKINYRFSS